LEERRRVAESANIDVLVWSNDRVIRWVQSIGLKVGRKTFHCAIGQLPTALILDSFSTGIREQSSGIRRARRTHSPGRKFRCE